MSRLASLATTAVLGIGMALSTGELLAQSTCLTPDKKEHPAPNKDCVVSAKIEIERGKTIGAYTVVFGGQTYDLRIPLQGRDQDRNSRFARNLDQNTWEERFLETTRNQGMQTVEEKEYISITTPDSTQKVRLGPSMQSLEKKYGMRVRTEQIGNTYRFNRDDLHALWQAFADDKNRPGHIVPIDFVMYRTDCNSTLMAKIMSADITYTNASASQQGNWEDERKQLEAALDRALRENVSLRNEERLLTNRADSLQTALEIAQKHTPAKHWLLSIGQEFYALEENVENTMGNGGSLTGKLGNVGVSSRVYLQSGDGNTMISFRGSYVSGDGKHVLPQGLEPVEFDITNIVVEGDVEIYKNGTPFAVVLGADMDRVSTKNAHQGNSFSPLSGSALTKVLGEVGGSYRFDENGVRVRAGYAPEVAIRDRNDDVVVNGGFVGVRWQPHPNILLDGAGYFSSGRTQASARIDADFKILGALRGDVTLSLDYASIAKNLPGFSASQDNALRASLGTRIGIGH